MKRWTALGILMLAGACASSSPTSTNAPDTPLGTPTQKTFVDTMQQYLPPIANDIDATESAARRTSGDFSQFPSLQDAWRQFADDAHTMTIALNDAAPSPSAWAVQVSNFEDALGRIESAGRDLAACPGVQSCGPQVSAATAAENSFTDAMNKLSAVLHS